MLPGKNFQPSALVRRNPRYLQNNCGKPGNSRLLGFRHLFQTRHVFVGDVRLAYEPEDIVLSFYSLAFAFGQPLAAFAHMNFVALTGKLLVCSHAPTNPAEVSHTSSFSTAAKDNKKEPDGRECFGDSPDYLLVPSYRRSESFHPFHVGTGVPNKYAHTS